MCRAVFYIYYGTLKVLLAWYVISTLHITEVPVSAQNGPSSAGADDEDEEHAAVHTSAAAAAGGDAGPSQPASAAEAQAAEHEAEVTGVRSTATDTGRKHDPYR